MAKKIIIIVVVLLSVVLISAGGALFYLTRTASPCSVEDCGEYQNEIFGISACDLGIGEYIEVNQSDLLWNPVKYCVKKTQY